MLINIQDNSQHNYIVALDKKESMIFIKESMIFCYLS